MVDLFELVAARLADPDSLAASRAWKWRIASFCAICAPGSPVQAETPFAIVLATSFDQQA